MKYKLLRFTLLSALVLLCGGGIFALGHALTKAQDEAQPEVTLDFTDKDAWNIPTSGSSNKDLASFTDGTNTIKLYATTNYKMNTGYLILGKKDSYLELPAFDFDVEKIEVTGTSGASESVKQNIYVGDEAVSTETTGAKNVTNTYLINSAYQAAGNIYKLKVTSAHNTQITYIKVYKKEDSRIATTMTLTNIAKVGVVNDASSFPTKEVKGNDGTTIETYMDEVSYVIADPTVATVFEGNKIKYLATGTTTVTINWSGNSNYQPCSASYNLTVVDNPYTSFAALQAAATTTSTSVGITLNGQKVVYVNGNNAYLADSEGNGLLVYTKDHGLRAGSTLTGTFGCNLVLYQGNTEITDFELSDLDGNEFGNAEPVAMVLGDITTANQSTLITLTNVTYDAENKVFTDGTNTIAYFNKFCKTADNPEPVLEDGRTYEVTGIIVLYNETIEICPREAADVKDISTDPVGFRDIKVTLADADKWQALVANGASVYITVAEDGTISTTDNADIAAATLTGKWHSTGYGWSNFTASVPVEGCVKITYATHDYGNDIVVTNDAGEEVAKLNTTGAKWSSDPSNVVVAYYRTNAPTTLHFSKANYNPYFAVEAIDEADLPAEITVYNITFAAGEGTGNAPAALEVNAGEKFKAPKNYTLYAEGKTLTGWSDGTTTYPVGQEITPEADMTLTAVFTANEVNLADRSSDVVISYDLSGYNDGPKYHYEGNTGIIVTQATVNGNTIDVKADVDATGGKFAYNGSGWHQVNIGTKLTVPSCKGAQFEVQAYSNPEAVHFNGSAEGVTTSENNAAFYTATTDAATTEIEQTANGYWQKVIIYLPVVGDDPMPTGFRDIKADLTKLQNLATGSEVYIAVAEDGTISQTDNAEAAAATLKGNWHSTGYGWSNFTASVPVEGCVKITYATHDYGNDIVVTNDAGEEVAKLNTTGAKWSSDPSNVVVAYYRTNAPTTLHFSKANYNPYFAVEAIDEADLPPLPTTITLTYYDTDGTTIIGTQELDGQVEIGQFQYDAADVTVAEGKAFRGWFATANGGKKYQTTDVPEGDLALYAVATDIEVAEAGKTFTYNLTNQFFYFEDHELISTTGNGYWHDSTHGWAFKNGDVVTLEVAGNATITATLCQYGSGTGIAVKKDGETLGTIDGIAASDGGTAVFNYEGEAGTLTLEMQCGGEMYIHAISVNNASGETPQPHDPVTLIWDYTEQNIPTQGPDNGLYYGAYVNDAAGTNNGMHGVKLNSSGWAYFEKPAVAGKLTLTFGNRKTADAYAVNVFKGTLNAEGKGVKGDLIGEIAISESPGSGSIELDADVTGVYIERKTSSEGVLQKIVFKESVPRTFVDFEITNEQLKGEFDSSTLPEGVLFSGTQRNDDHGYGNVTIVVPVDGTVKFSIGGCQYANPANCKVTNAAGETLATPNLKTTKCYHQDGTVVTYFYVGEPTTLTFSDIAYLPYFKAEATEVSEVTITYKDHNGNVLGKKTIYEGDPIGEIPYTEADLNIGEGVKFRGWIYTSGIKVKTTDIVSANITVSALVTPIEHSPEVGTVQTYDLTKATFYPEDHENFNVEGGYYHDGQHGWAFNNGEKFEVAVGGKAQIVLTLCQYSKANATFTVKDAQNNVVADDVPGVAETDGATTIVNYDGQAGMLSFTYNTEGESYLHSVKVYNVSDFVEKDEASNYYIIPAGDGAGLIMAINQASSEENSKIFLPNGTYDFGETVLTGISGKNVSIIGESMEGVIIKTAPDISLEGLGSADLLVNTGEGLYLQDLTLQNALDFYAAGSAGRAVTLHDKGTKTINKNVRHLSYQDTYYSHKTGGLFYFEGGEIHGTVDYMCGYGRVYFNKVTLVNEQRNTATMTANSELYVFNECVVENNADVYNFGRAWSNHPTCIFLNTTLKDPDKLATTRWNLTGINCDYSIAGEYGTMNAQGENITPAANNVTFTKENTSMNTILDASALETYSIQNVLGEWAETAQDQAKQVTAPTAELKDGTISWEPVADATAYALFKDGEFIGITTETSFVVETGDAASSRAQDTAVYTIRAANERGGFGEPTLVTVADGIQKLNVENIEGLVIYDLQGRRVNTVTSGIYIINGKKTLIK